MTAAALILTEQNVASVKDRLREYLPDAKSSHITEALARALGHRTHASLLSGLKAVDPRDPDIVPADDKAFYARLAELGCAPSEDDLEAFHVATSGHGDGVICIEAEDAYKYEYVGKRQNAWRNMMVAAINAGIEQKLFSVIAGDNRWPGHDDRQNPFVFRFTFDGDLPAVASVLDIGWDELSIKVGVQPTPRGAQFVRTFNAGFHAADAFATGWLERRKAAYLMYSKEQFRCRKNLLPRIAAARVEPKCFGDRGRVIN